LTISRPRFKTRKTEDPGQDPHWQDVTLLTSWQHFRPVPHERDPRTTSLRLARQVSASCELLPTPTGAWAMTRGASLRHGRLHRNAWGNDSRAVQMPQLAAMQAAGPDKSLNAGLPGCTVIPSTSSPTLPHTSFTCGTQAPPTTSSSLA
jgi:hypothetical protein